MIALIEETDALPTVAQISERSGVSHRSVYRYFDDLDSLFTAAVSRAFLRYTEYGVIHRYGDGSLEERIDAIVEQRLRLFAAMAPLARASRRRGDSFDAAEAALEHYMAGLRDQVAHQFGRELGALPVPQRDRRVGALDVLLSYDGYAFLVRHGHDHAAIAVIYDDGIRALVRGRGPG